MEWITRRTSVWKRNSVFWIFTVLFAITAAETSHSHSALGISAPHLFYTCPEGATAKLKCVQKADATYSLEALKSIWLFTEHSDQHCKGATGPRHMSPNHLKPNGTLQAGLQYGHTKEMTWLLLKNVTIQDQGRYCCLAFDTKKHPSPPKFHSHIILHVTPKRNGPLNCSVWDPTPPGGTVPVALALAACILAVLSLPLILVLVYKQRQNAQSNRRAQELVRMDSEAQGHENPVFFGGSPQVKTRTVSQIMTRQTSETGRHLLSEPETPLSPSVHGDVFFPSEDIIPESPDLLQV